MTSAIATVGICSPIVPATKRHAVDGLVGEWNRSVAEREQHALGVLRETFGPERGWLTLQVRPATAVRPDAPIHTFAAHRKKNLQRLKKIQSQPVHFFLNMFKQGPHIIGHNNTDSEYIQQLTIIKRISHFTLRYVKTCAKNAGQNSIKYTKSPKTY